MSALDINPGASPAEPSSSIPSGLPIPTRLALQIASKIAIGQLTVTLPDGRSVVFVGKTPGPKAVLVVNDHRFATRILRDGDIGVADGFLSGDWTSPDLPVFLELFCVNAEHTSAHLLAKPLFRALQNFQHWLRRNTKAGARRNIEAHYDLGNAFYEQWLDPSMTYSSALFEEGVEDLEEAQRAKYRALADAAGMREGEHVLEIGCGWGGFAEFAAKEVGARVTALTISPAQLDYARRRIFQAGLSERVTFKLQDYRDERGVFDRIASIEMFEAVGEKWWPAFFGQLRDRLRPGGAAGVQVITIQDRLFEAYRRETDFIQRYVFPGGMLPSPTALRAAATKAGLAISDERIFGLDYAATLSKWRDRFRAAWPTIQPLGFDERFRRLWEYYLAYCEAGFSSGNIDVRQVIFARS